MAVRTAELDDDAVKRGRQRKGALDLAVNVCIHDTQNVLKVVRSHVRHGYLPLFFLPSPSKSILPISSGETLLQPRGFGHKIQQQKERMSYSKSSNKEVDKASVVALSGV